MWFGETTSRVGTAVTSVALPLVAVSVLRASAFEVGLLTAVQWFPWLVIGLPAGVWVDRLPARSIMLAADVVSMAAIGTVPLLAALGVLRIGYLFLAACAVGIASVFFSTAYVVYVRDLVPGPDLAAANAMLQGSESVAEIAGPSFAGVIADALGAVAGLVADAASFAMSLLCLLAIGRSARRTERQERRSLRAEVAAGLGFVARDRLLRLLTVVSALGNLFVTAYQALFVLFLVRVVGLPFTEVGLLMAAAGAGGCSDQS